MNRADLQRLARIRVKEARILFNAGLYSGAYYLAGYAVECALKACIAKTTVKHEFPDKQKAIASYSHKLDDLHKVADLASSLTAETTANPRFGASWALVKNWSEASRYKTWTKTDADSIIEAISKKPDGVLPWIMQRW